MSDNVQGLRTGPLSCATTTFFDLPLLYSNALRVVAGWVEGRLWQTEPEAHCYRSFALINLDRLTRRARSESVLTPSRLESGLSAFEDLPDDLLDLRTVDGPPPRLRDSCDS